MVDLDGRIRLAGFNIPTKQPQLMSYGVLARTILAIGFTFNGIFVSAIRPRGHLRACRPGWGRLANEPACCSTCARLIRGVRTGRRLGP